MHAWESIQKSIDFIEAHLTEEIQLETLASVAALSPFYFQRLFHRLVRKPVYEYVKLRRLAEAAFLLQNETPRILDIAMEYGFSSHANFTRSFKETFGITPAEYRKNPVVLNQFVKPELILDYIMIDEGVPLVTDGMVLEINRKQLSEPRFFAGIEAHVPVEQLMGGETTGIAVAAALWDTFHQEKHKIPGLLPSGNELGALYMGSAKEGFCTYMAGAEIIPGTKIEGYTSFELPPNEYLVCGFETETISELYGAAVFKADKFMGHWMEKHKLTCTDFAIEMYYPKAPEAAYLEHWIVPVMA